MELNIRLFCVLQVVETLDERIAIPRQHLWLPELLLTSVGSDGDADQAEEEPDPDAWESLPTERKLADVLGYLRNSHHYCLFCGCQVDLLMRQKRAMIYKPYIRLTRPMGVMNTSRDKAWRMLFTVKI